MAAPMELNILWEKNKELLKQKIYLCIKLGYECFAVNNHIEDFSSYHTAKKKQKAASDIPTIKPPSDIVLTDEEIEDIKTSLGVTKRIRQLSRITINTGDMNHINKIQRDEVIRSYDLIAVRPLTEKILQSACASLDIDIISLNLAEKIPFKIKRNNVGQAVERGLFFEICYAPMIRDSTLRRYTISNAELLISVCKGKNVIMTSECEKVMELRAPYDVQNLTSLFNMPSDRAKHSITTNCEKCALHGATAGKRASKCIVTITKLENDKTDKVKEVTTRSYVNPATTEDYNTHAGGKDSNVEYIETEDGKLEQRKIDNKKQVKNSAGSGSLSPPKKKQRTGNANQRTL